MGDVEKNRHVSGGALASDLRSLASMVKTRRTVALAYVCMLCFVFFTLLLAFNPSTLGSGEQDSGAGARISSVFSYYFPEVTEVPDEVAIFGPNRTNPVGSDLENPRFDAKKEAKIADPFAPAGQKQSKFSPPGESEHEKSTVKTEYGRSSSPPAESVLENTTEKTEYSRRSSPPAELEHKNSTEKTEYRRSYSPPAESENKNSTVIKEIRLKSSPPAESVHENSTVKTAHRRSSLPAAVSEYKNSTMKTENSRSSSPPAKSEHENSTNKTEHRRISSPPAESSPTNSIIKTEDGRSSDPPDQPGQTIGSLAGSTNYSVRAPAKKRSNGSDSGWVESLLRCDLYDGDWVVDDSYPLYEPGSCPLIDEQFSCISNGRPDNLYLKYKWKPNACTLPRLDPNRLLQMLKHKRLVFVGDSLNRNMWESMVCILTSAVKNRANVYESHGRHYFRGEAEYSFVFKDYNFTVEFYASPFLVQEWEVKDKDGAPKERLRLDLIGKTCGDYKGADILIFNTGHWWTHEKTSLGKDYYQEGRHVYEQLNVLEAFRKALTTWGRWVDANVDPEKSIVLFRGYAASHFSGGQWNSGGACDNETEPIRNPKYLTAYPTKMTVLEEVMKSMKTNVKYMNITRLTDYRKDGHPSIYRKKNIPEAERQAPMRYQDCSHWCLPGVPDTWNELLYAELLIRQRRQQQQQ